MSHFGPIPRYETNIRRATFESDCLENLYASQLLAILVLTCSKAAVVLLVLSLKPFEKIKYACNVALGAIGVWALASLIGLGVQCKQPEPWHFSSERCAHQHALYIGLAIVHIILDMAVIVLPVTLLWTVRMIQWRRYQISALFAIRLIVPALTIPGLLSLRPVFNATPPDPSWHALMPAIWLQLVLSTSIVCNCIPPLRRVLADLQTGMMAGTVTEFFEYSVSGGRSNITGDRSGSRSGSQIGPKKSRSRRSKSRNIFQGSSAVHSMDRRESQRNLREDVILQTIDYEVHYDGIRRTRTSPSCEEESFRSDV
ncbi:predicted protein [Aspergillus terreus NIH2624]|uniref:Rhodopsin domain-containing protein n=1 Tax=Aspergillus terreus (strain NIH 2624 / FGSC A1156) TaxID=341663 RepID=Q0C999_ASPTN|nr:uncharacterized protein ATEG_09735 [Aspergillus terreus NIH2624]EAU29926.1 predicted protein [Aspergillus terreus NIH2624]